MTTASYTTVRHSDGTSHAELVVGDARAAAWRIPGEPGFQITMGGETVATGATHIQDIDVALRALASVVGITGPLTVSNIDEDGNTLRIFELAV